MADTEARRGARARTARLFLALWPDEAARRLLAAWRDRWGWPRGTALVADERLHQTLHFIGAVPRERLDEVAAGLAVDWRPFRFGAGQGRCWRGGIAAWVPDETPVELVDAHARLAHALRRLALPVEQRAFRPHVTVARKAARATAPVEPPLVLDWAVDAYALVVSEGGYRVLRRYP